MRSWRCSARWPQHREVHLWLPHPSPALWARIPAPESAPLRRADPTATIPRHPLLASLGRDVRELQLRLTALDSGLASRSVHHRLPEPPETLLGRLQRELRDDTPPAVPVPVAEGDASVAVHFCHGPDRQVEVLREIVLGLLAADPTLEPRDIVVLCPDIETFAPLISATFGLGDLGHPGHRVAVRLADRALRQVNPLLDTVERLLELARHRLTAFELIDLLASHPVRTRFDLDDDDLERLRTLVVAAGVRWGLDAAHRGPYRLDGFAQNTWSSGLDRLLLGVAMPGATRDWLGTALPLGDVDSGDTERLGALTEFVERLTGVLDSLQGEQPLQRWIDVLLEALDLLTATSATDAWQGAHARAELADAAVAAGPHAATVPLGLADVRGLLTERLRGGPTRASFRTGTLTVATLVPMRSVPHRVVCLLGLDDGAFPRATAVDGDDLLARDPRVGDRDVRSEDRQLLLDAVCAATDRLVVVASGADERTGARRPPAVPLGELIDAITATAGVEGARRIVVRHPLQPFDARNFRAGQLGGAAPFSFDTASLAGARAAAGPRVPPRAFLPEPLPPLARDPLPLDDLVRFVEHPVKAFLVQRAGVPVADDEDEPSDALPVEPDALARWAIGDRVLRDRLAGLDLDRCRKAEWRRGALPPGALGDALLASVLDDVEPLVAASSEVRGAGEPADVDVEVAVPGGRVVGTVSGIHAGTLVRVEFSKLGPKHRLRAWVQLLALTAATGQEWRAATVGRGRHQGIVIARLGPVEPGAAAAALADLVDMASIGRCTPLPLPTVSAHQYARVRRAGGGPDDALAEAVREWSGGQLPRAGRRPVPAGVGPAGGPGGAHLGGRPGGRRADVLRRARHAPVGAAAAGRGPGAALMTTQMTAQLPVAAFDVCGALPSGTTVLEASAGTGKTYTIASLAVRYVAEGHAELPELMLVTFGREATQELRERVRERLGAVERALSDPPAARTSGDEVTALLAAVDDAEVLRRRERLTRALAQFDAATIATTHQFCQQMLAGLGVAGDRDADARFVESVEDLLTEVVDDFYVRKYGDRSAGTPAFSRRDALELARVAVHDEQARLEPRDAEAGSTAEVRYRFAAAVRAEVDPPQARAAHLHLRRHAHPARGGAGRSGARCRRSAAGPVPGRARRRVPGHRPGAVGDPAAGVPRPHHAGADRRSQAGHLRVPRRRRAQLPRRHRGRRPARHAGHQLAQRRPAARRADPGVRRRRAGQRADHRASRRGGAHRPAGAGRAVAGADAGPRRVAGGAQRAGVRRGGPPGGGRRRRGRHRRSWWRVARRAAESLAGDIAVLVRTNDQGSLVHAALTRAGVPAVLSGTANVFGAAVAREWLQLLQACEAPRAVRLRGAALTSFLGHTVDELCGPDAEALLDRIGVPGPGLGGRAARAGRGGAAGVRHHRHRPAGAAAGAGRRRARPHRPAPHRPGPARGRRHGAPRPGRARRLVGAPHPRGRPRQPCRGGSRTEPAPGVRRGRRADHHDPPQQGPRVPGRVRAVRLGPQRPRSRGAAAARRRRRAGARRGRHHR